MAEGAQENVNHIDLKNRLKTLDCHFNWGILRQSPPKTAFISAFAAMDYYNAFSALPLRRFAFCLHAAYITIKRVETCDKLLFVANRIVEHCRDPTSPEPPSQLPVNPYEEGIWELPIEEFLAKCEELTGDEDTVEVSSESGSDDNYKIFHEESKEEVKKENDGEVEDGTLELWKEDRFTGMYTGAKYLLDSFRTFTLFLNDAPNTDVEDIFASITPMSQMPASDCAFIRYVESFSWKLLGMTTHWLNALGGTVLADPTDVKWYLFVMEILYGVRAERHIEWGRKVEWKDIETFLDVTDSILDLKPAPWMVVNLNFEKLQAINDYMVSFRRVMPLEENQRLSRICFNLCKKVIENTTQTEFLAYCAQILSRRPETMELAVSTIEKAVALAVDHDRHYINAKACNIFMKDKTRLEEALACAELAAPRSYGSNWQVLEMKIRLGHKINAEEFFKDIRARCKCRTHIEELHVHAFLYYICKTKDIEGAIKHIKTLLKLASIRKSKDIMGSMFCTWTKEDVIMAEAGYNVVQYVLNGDYKDDGIQLTDETVEMCRKLKDALEKHLEGRSLGRLTPKEYVRWLRGSKNRPRESASATDGESGENSFWPHQKYTQQMCRRRTTSNSSGSSYGGYGNSYRGGNSGYSGDRSSDNYRRGGLTGRNGRDEVTLEKRPELSWRTEMRPNNADTNPLADTNAANPGSSSGRYQTTRPWRSQPRESPDPNQTNSRPNRFQDRRDPQTSNNQTGGGPWTVYPNWRNPE